MAVSDVPMFCPLLDLWLLVGNCVCARTAGNIMTRYGRLFSLSPVLSGPFSHRDTGVDGHDAGDFGTAQTARM